tara:strand:- start:44 stop:241 length:198 start_codon:yes stop_codon:yes gene_type:complete
MRSIPNWKRGCASHGSQVGRNAQTLFLKRIVSIEGSRREQQVWSKSTVQDKDFLKTKWQKNKFSD